jgi:ribosome biogenesis protein Tsr3
MAPVLKAYQTFVDVSWNFCSSAKSEGKKLQVGCKYSKHFLLAHNPVSVCESVRLSFVSLAA